MSLPSHVYLEGMKPPSVNSELVIFMSMSVSPFAVFEKFLSVFLQEVKKIRPIKSTR